MTPEDFAWISMVLAAMACSVLSHEALNPLQNQPVEHHHQPQQQQQEFQQLPVGADLPSRGRHQPHRSIDRQSVHDEEHLKEHMSGQIKEDEKLSDEEIQFRYFKVHDYDGNNLLDGIELIKALTHHHKGDGEEKRISDKSLSSMISEILENNDRNQDGYIDYAEFIASQRSNTG